MTNQDMEKLVETSDSWIMERTGIKSRHISTDEETTAYLATEAAKRALAGGRRADEGHPDREHQ